MSDPPLPADVLDHIADHLHDKPETLKQCCLASKSWIPRTRKHLFADIKLDTTRDLRSWKRTFPDPSTSPARYAKTLSVGRPEVIRDVDAEVGGWITGFSRVEHLDLGAYEPDWGFDQPAVPFVPFHGFSPVMKSLRVATISLPPSPIINLILSFPLLEDLAVAIDHGIPDDTGDGSEGDEVLTAAQPLSPPMFTGSLELHLRGVGAEHFIRRLSSLPGGIHFRKLTLTYRHGGDLSLTTASVEGCSHTLEPLDIALILYGMSSQHLCPYRQFTSISRRVRVRFGGPLESDKTQGCDFSARAAESRMGRQGSPNHHTRAPRSSTGCN
jgi:hypothetical protein